MRDRALFRYQKKLWETENIFIEPSACAGFHSYVQLARACAAGLAPETLHPALRNAAHIVWATGGSLVPEQERQTMLQTKTCPEDLGAAPGFSNKLCRRKRAQAMPARVSVFLRFKARRASAGSCPGSAP